jgi:hypothetical protein
MGVKLSPEGPGYYQLLLQDNTRQPAPRTRHAPPFGLPLRGKNRLNHPEIGCRWRFGWKNLDLDACPRVVTGRREWMQAVGQDEEHIHFRGAHHKHKIKPWTLSRRNGAFVPANGGVNLRNDLLYQGKLASRVAPTRMRSER